MCRRRRRFAALTVLLLVGLPSPLALAGGWLWLGAEFAGEGHVYTYRIDSNVVDQNLSPALPGGGAHWNNAATDGLNLYLGTPNTQYLGVYHIITGDFIKSFNYAPALTGDMEDGAFFPLTGHLWRATDSNAIHETTRDGQSVRSFTNDDALMGLEWVGTTLYATNYTGRDIGYISFNDSSATFVEIPWAPGHAPSSNTAGLAYDREARVLYMVADLNKLYSVTFADGMAMRSLVVDLTTVGYPSGGLIGGMGWSGPVCSFARDDDIDLVDHHNFIGCLVGPKLTRNSLCTCSDIDDDLHVDLSDFSWFQNAFTGGDALSSDLAVFTDTKMGLTTSDVRDVHDEIVHFNPTRRSIIYVATGVEYRVGEWPVNGNFLYSGGSFQVRFGTENGERRAYFTETGSGTICNFVVSPSSFQISATNEHVPPP